ncbi:Putative lumazine-binding [Algoriphagus faecimaris]|uniref:Putative lumazine-binding n=1 Tax=Algoriphagus faecimaris TaxID=686796 RepID=A0A1G6R3T5_9BACT|nr:nuclear transport factor 2 family protein [Algoriphagus faecimaris]SDC98725.1 Putative lumazine-binding [Algoriphagus faecimaris]
MKKLLLLVFQLGLVGVTFAQEPSDRDLISKTVNLYFDGMMDRDFDKLQEAFHPEARLIGYRGERLTVTEFNAWASATSSGSPRNKEEFKNEIVSIRVQGNTASVETELFWPGIYYYDFLTLIKIEGKWKIVHKSWWEKPL